MKECWILLSGEDYGAEQVVGVSFSAEEAERALRRMPLPKTMLGYYSLEHWTERGYQSAKVKRRKHKPGKATT